MLKRPLHAFSSGAIIRANWRVFTMDITAISAQLENYENKWIAIDESEEKIVGVGDDAFEATENAERSGYQDTILFKVPSFDSALIPLA
jgi:Family of unknown function (DUF5678)